MSNIEMSADIKSLMTALLKAQEKLHGVARDSINPHFKNRYASLEAVITAAKEPLREQGILFIQAIGKITDGSLEIDTMLIHAETCQWMRSTAHMPLSKMDPQGAGSAGTYGERYSLMAILGLPPIDDDGEQAIDRTDSRPVPQAKPQAQAKQQEAITLVQLEKIASTGSVNLKLSWESMTPALQKRMEPHKEGLKAMAAEADAERGFVQGDMKK